MYSRPLREVPVVRRIEYLLDYLLAVDRRCTMGEIEEILSERKRQFEMEKILAVGRGNPFRRDLVKTSRLAKECFRLAKALRYVEKFGNGIAISDKGRHFLDVSNEERRILLAEAYSEVYPHLATLALTLSKLDSEEAVLPMMNKPKFRPEAEKIGLNIGQVTFDIIRDIATSLGILNWYHEGDGVQRRQHVYLTCSLATEVPRRRSIRLYWDDDWLYVVERLMDRASIRDTLWKAYLALADGIPGSPIFYSAVREKVCANLRIRDDQFDAEVLQMVDWDDVFQVVWSEGVLPYQRDSAGMLKSLPPKTESGNYIVYLKIVRRG